MKSLLLKIIKSVLIGKKKKKKKDFDLSKYQIYFVVCGENWFLKIKKKKKKSDLCLLHKIKPFDLKNIRSVFKS